MTDNNTIPLGYKADARGHLVPIDNIRPEDNLRDDLIDDLMVKAKAMRATLQSFKKEAFKDCYDFLDLIFREYQVEPRGKKGNVTFTSFDGQRKVTIQMADCVDFSEKLHVAKAKIDSCLKRWSEGANQNLRAVIDQAFDTDKSGSLIASRILGLRRLNILDDEWREAMELISDSIQITGTSRYIRFYERVGDADQWEAIILDFARV